MTSRRNLLSLLALSTIGATVLAPVRTPAQQSSRSAAATQVVDSAVRTGRIDRRLATELSASKGQPVRALVVTSPRSTTEQTFEAQQASLASDKDELALIPGVSVQQLLPSLNTTVVEISSAEALAALAALPDATVMADELFQRSDYESEQIIQAPVVRSYGYDGVGTYIGIIDSGIDYTHYDLGSCSAPGAPTPCRVGILAPDFSHNADGSIYDDGMLDDSVRHGTNVAATASAIAPAARLIGADVFGASGAYASDIAAAIQYMINLKAAGYPIVAVNMSLGNRLSTCVDVLGVSALRKVGILAVVSAGNSAYVNGVFSPGLSNPACVPGVIAVGAVFDGYYGYVSSPNCPIQLAEPSQVACFSQTSSSLTLLAPGTFITAGGVTMSGTSQAAPHVSGALATIAAAVPQASVNDLVYGITYSSATLYDPRIGLSFPRLNVPDALAATEFRVLAFGPESFDQALVLGGPSGNVSTTAGYTAQNGEPSHGGRTGISSTWFAWTAPSTGKATFTTSGSSFDTAMSVYAGSALNNLTEVGSNDDSSLAGSAAVVGPMEVISGQRYRIAVSCGVTSSSCGSINLAWNFSGDSSGPSNDTHTSAVALVGLNGTLTANNAFSTPQSGEPLQSGGSSAKKSVWFKYSSAGLSTLAFSTAGSNYDTTLSLFEGNDPALLRPVTSHNNVGPNGAKFDVTSRVSLTTSRSPTTYWISIDSPSGQTGTAQLSWSGAITGTPQSAPATTVTATVRQAAPTAAGPAVPVPSPRTAAPRSGPDPVTIV
jgi:subtilisin family serine protease